MQNFVFFACFPGSSADVGRPLVAMLLVGLPDDLWRVVLSHSSFRALARLALTSNTLAVRMQPAASFQTSFPAVREYILTIEGTPEALTDALRYVELRYELTVADKYLFANSWSSINPFVPPVLTGLNREDKLASLVQRVRTEEDKSKLADILLKDDHLEDLMCAIIMRLTPAESILVLTSYVQHVRQWRVSTVGRCISLTLSRAQWTAEQLAQLASMMASRLDEEPTDEVELPTSAMVAIAGLTENWRGKAWRPGPWSSKAQREAILQGMPLPLMERAQTLCHIHLFCWQNDFPEFDSEDGASALSLANLAVAEHWDVPIVLKVLKMIIDGEKQKHQTLLSHLETYDSGYRRDQPDHTCGSAFLGTWSNAGALGTWSNACALPRALGQEDQAAVIGFIQGLSPSAKKQLYLVFLSWALPLLPAGFVADAGWAWKKSSDEEATPSHPHAEAMCRTHLFVENKYGPPGDYVLQATVVAIGRLAGLAAGEHSSAFIKMLEVIIEGEERRHDDLLEASFEEGLDYVHHEPNHTCSRLFLRRWSNAVSLTTALGPNKKMARELRRLARRGTIEGAAVLRCIQALPGTAKAQLFPIFLEWALPLLPAGFVADVGHAMQ